MFVDWIKMRVDLDQDPRVVAVALALQEDAVATVGRFWKLWSRADQCTTDGRLPGVTPAVIDHLVGKQGFAAAAANAGWLTFTDAGAEVPHFFDHNGESGKARALSAKRKRKGRCENVPRAAGQQRDKKGRNAHLAAEAEQDVVKDVIQQQQDPVTAAAAQKLFGQCRTPESRARQLASLPHASAVAAWWPRRLAKGGLDNPGGFLRDVLTNPEGRGFRCISGQWVSPPDPESDTPKISLLLMENNHA
jgi:hypothetical protein